MASFWRKKMKEHCDLLAMLSTAYCENAGHAHLHGIKHSWDATVPDLELTKSGFAHLRNLLKESPNPKAHKWAHVAEHMLEELDFTWFRVFPDIRDGAMQFMTQEHLESLGFLSKHLHCDAKLLRTKLRSVLQHPSIAEYRKANRAYQNWLANLQPENAESPFFKILQKHELSEVRWAYKWVNHA